MLRVSGATPISTSWFLNPWVLAIGEKVSYVGCWFKVHTPFREPCLSPARYYDLKFKFIHSIVSNSLWPHGLLHIRLPCPSPTPGVYSNLCPLSRWCHPTISSSFIPFSSYLQSFPASGFFQMSQLFALCGQNIGVSASASVLPMNIQDQFPLGLTDWISLLSNGLSRVFSNSMVQNHQFFVIQLSL